MAAPAAPIRPVPMAPGRLPLLGHAAKLLRAPLPFLSSLPATGDLVEIQLGTQSAYVVCTPELAHHVLTDSRTFDKAGLPYELIKPLLGNGLITSTHTPHRRQRRLVQPAFHPQRLASYAESMNIQIAAELGTWREGATIDVYERMGAVATRTAAATMFAADVAGPALTEMSQSLTIFLAGMYHRVLDPTGLLGRLPTPGNRRYRHALHTLHVLVDDIITAYRRSGRDHGDLLSTLLSARGQDDDEPLSDSEIHDQVINLFVAGAETTASTASWALHLLATHPAIARQVETEIEGVLHGRRACHSDLPQLDLIRRVITETLRLYPPVWLSCRATTTATTLGGHPIPADRTIMWSPYLLHRHPGLYTEPHRFDPSRWSDDCAKTPRGAFVPFSLGARRCIGDQFAMTEVTLIIAAVVGARWRLRPLSEADAVPAPRTMTLRPVRLPVRLSRG